jgi:hypothetical protein
MSKKSFRLSRRPALIFTVVFAAIGVGIWLYQGAANFNIATEAESGALSTPASVVESNTAANGKAVKFGGGGPCGNATTGHKIDTVIVVSEENRSWSAVGGPGFSASTMPYSNKIASQCAYFTLDTEANINDNSGQQYVGAWTGYDSSVTHVASDCSPSATCSYTGNNLFRTFRAAGIPHREYVEGATAACSSSGNAARHIPELYMWDATDKAACPSEVLPLGQLNFTAPPTGFTFVSPNLCNDGHDCGNASVDAWLADPSRLPALFNSVAYRSGRVLLELWWDEDHPRPNLFACNSCKAGLVSDTDPHFAGESRLWLNLLGAPSGNLGAISTAADIRPILGTP